MSSEHGLQRIYSSRSGQLGWLMRRITGVGLLFFVGLHFWIQHMPNGFLATAEEYNEIIKGFEKITPEFADAIAKGKIREALPGEHVITYDKVFERLRTPLWKTVDITLLLFALLHGMLGMANVLGDYIQNASLRKVAMIFCWAVILFLATQGIVTVMTVGTN